jgi:hypothetical protein
MMRYSMRKRLIGHGPGDVAAAESGRPDLMTSVRQRQRVRSETKMSILSGLLPLVQGATA